MSTNALINFDFTLKKDEITPEELIDILKEWCREWAFQLEKGTKTDYVHYQGRMKMKEKIRGTTLYNKLGLENMYLTPTSKNNVGNNFYVLKEDTRIEGPWTSEDKIKEPMPWDLQLVNELRDWQQSLLEISKTRVLRGIHVIVDTVGGIGKTTFCKWMQYGGHAQMIPFANDHKDICRIVMDTPPNICYMFDMPRALHKKNLQSLWAGIEMVKNGTVYDDRYSYKSRTFGVPIVIVFTNEEPELSMLSRDRWLLYNILDNKLVKKL